jgi:hypothetical protein
MVPNRRLAKFQLRFSEVMTSLRSSPRSRDQRRPHNLRPDLIKLEFPSQICPVAIVLRSPYGN